MRFMACITLCGVTVLRFIWGQARRIMCVCDGLVWKLELCLGVSGLYGCTDGCVWVYWLERAVSEFDLRLG